MKSALLVINTTTYFPALIEIGRLLQKNSQYKPVFYFTQPYDKYQQDIAVCEAENMRTVCGFAKVNIVNRDASRLSRRQVLIKKWLIALYRNFFVGLSYETQSYVREFVKIKKLIKSINPSILIIAGDNIGYNTDIFVKICHRYSIPSVIIPLWMTNANEAAEAYYNNPAYDGRRLANRILGYFDRKWIYEHRGKKLIRWPAFKIIAMKMFGLVPPLPWILNSSFADLILAAHKAMEDLMLEVGIKPDQVRLIGSMVDDIMAENIKHFAKRRENLCAKLDLDKDKPILLCALPPKILYIFSRSQCDFKNYDDLVEFWIKSIMKVKNYNVIISLHPAISYEEIKHIEKWGVKIAKDKIIDLVPFCDVFVASMSATINFAVACGKPTINYDVYRFKDIYWRFKGVLDTEEKAEFLVLLKKLTEDENFYSQVLARQKSESGRCGILDGKCGERILGAVEELIAKYNA